MKRYILIMAVLLFGTGAPADAVKYEAGGRRDPFVPLIGQEKAETAGLSGVASVDDIRLEGIAASANGRMTVIMNGEMLSENDKVGVVEVRNISGKTVTVLINGKEYKLNLPEEGGVKSE